MHKKQIADIQPTIPISRIDNRTIEGVFCETSTSDLIRFGSLLFFMSEFASPLKIGGKQTLAFGHGFTHCYHNQFLAKRIKADSKRIYKEKDRKKKVAKTNTKHYNF